MTVSNDLAIKFLSDLNIKRFVLARENSLNEIKLIKQQTEKELEVFVHGALCVSYSGQCFTSENLGGRSANRGQCAQSCRFSYDLLVDGQKQNQVDKNYLVSPQDLCGLKEIPELMEIGVSSFKIEGRLKTPEYVAATASEYRHVMNAYIQDSKKIWDDKEIQLAKNRMAMTYSRGYFSGWLHGVNHQKLVEGTYKSHRGVEIGKIISIKNEHLLVELSEATSNSLIPGDGLLWSQGEKEWGSFVFSIAPIRKNVFLIGIANDLEMDANFIGARLFKNHDKNLKRDLNKSFTDKNLFKKIPISVRITLELNQKLVASLSDGLRSFTFNTESSLAKAAKHPLSDEDLRLEFSSLGGTAFKLDRFVVDRLDSEALFISAKEVKVLRQKLVQAMTFARESERVSGLNVEMIPEFQLVQDKKQEQKESSTSDSLRSSVKPALTILLRNKEQVNDFCEALVHQQLDKNLFSTVILDFEFGRDLRPSIENLRKQQVLVGIATTRILKPQEYTNLKNIALMKPDIILARNLGAIYYFQHLTEFDGKIWGDFSLNATNHQTINYLLAKGLEQICLSYDLNQDQVLSVLQQTSASKVEVTLHQFMPSFHMEHCVFAAFLSQGSSYKDCGKPCEKHRVQLKDQFGHLHEIKPDPECRNTMFNAKAQTALNFIQPWLDQGLRRFRYEALNEVGEELISKLINYQNFFQGKQDLQETLTHLKTQEKYGLTEGHFSHEHKFQSRKKSFSFLKEDKNSF